MKRYFSYVRFSTPDQKMGDSERRQVDSARAWAKRKKVTLDESLTPDRGLSGYHGTHRTRGQLRVFLDMVRVGRVARGSTLVVEKVSRLSREGAFKTLKGIVFDLIGSGVTIQVLSPEIAFDQEAIEGPMFHVLIALLQGAYQESKDKSDYGKADWERRREAAAERPMNGVCPAWLDGLDEHGALAVHGARVVAFRPNPAAVETVQRIFEMAIAGHGLHAIAGTLNREKVPTIGRGTEWAPGYVGLILRNRAVLGELQPHRVRDGKRVPTGSALPGYYPAVVDESEFHQAAAALDSRRNQKGPRGKHVRNLFTGILRDARDGRTMVTNTESDKSRSVRLVSSGAGRGKSDYRTFPHDVFEAAVLRELRELKAADVLPGDRGREADDEVARQSGRLQEIDHKIARLMKDMKGDGEYDLGLRLLRDLEAEKKDAAGRLERAKARAATAEVEVLGETQTLVGLLAGAEGDERTALRTKIKARLRQLVDDARMLIVKRGSVRLAAVQLAFRGSDARRTYLIAHRTASRHRAAVTWSGSMRWPEDGFGLDGGRDWNEWDLRDPKQARSVLGGLERVPLELLGGGIFDPNHERNRAQAEAAAKQLREKIRTKAKQ